ncbi:MAG: DUF839 domain-containing protein [Phycisphaerae bacterium]
MPRMQLRVCALVLLSPPLVLAQFRGPSSTADAYVVPSAPGVVTRSILTVGDSVNNGPGGGPYRLVGAPDGLGAYLNADGQTFELLANHELSSGTGVVRLHGANGAFVSRWQINRATLQVVHGADVITGVRLWSPAAGAYQSGTTSFARFCSADLAAPAAFSNGAEGSIERIFLNGEENGTSGRAFAHMLTGADAGISWELPRLGKIAHENVVASPVGGAKTIVITTDDSTPGQVYLYVGFKNAAGTDIERAGLNNGVLFGVRVSGVATENRAAPPAAGTRFDLVNLGNVSSVSGTLLDSLSRSNGVTDFLRPEDGAWDPSTPTDFYFTTTDRFNTLKDAGTPAGQGGATRVYRLRFDDIATPETGGTITCIIDGGAAGVPGQMFDNIAIDRRGNILIQEDPGNQTYRSRIWSHDIATGVRTQVAEVDPRFFSTGGANFLTTNEETSGIVDAGDALGPGWFIFTVMAHYSIAGELVEGGQLAALFNPASAPPCPGDLNGDRTVDSGDLGILLSAWNATAAGDLNGDAQTNQADLGVLLGAWQATCP